MFPHHSIRAAGLVVTAALLPLSLLAASPESDGQEPGVYPQDHAEVRYGPSQEFTDFRIEMLQTDRDRQTLERDLAEQFDESARRALPEGHKLEIEVRNVDLAGEVFPAFDGAGNDRRVIKRLYPPRLEFGWRWLDADGELVLEGEETLVGTNVETLMRKAGFNRGTRLGVERELIDEWTRDLKSYWEQHDQQTPAE